MSLAVTHPSVSKSLLNILSKKGRSQETDVLWPAGRH